MFETRDRAEHDKRRKAWDQGFSTKALRNYESRIDGFAASFEQQMDAFAGKPMNISDWSNYFSFDVVGDLAYGKPFDMLREGTAHFVVKLLANGQKGLGIFGCVPWLFVILTKIPVLNNEYKAFLAWCEEQLTRRQKVQRNLQEYSGNN
jgi:cytochrome P450